jgi:hypothetical protein
MSDLHVSIALVLASLAGGLGWDCWLAYKGRLGPDGDWCAGARAINKATGGLFALCIIALFVHVFLYQYIPPDWKP